MENKMTKVIREWKKRGENGDRKKITWEEVGISRLILLFLAGVFLLLLSLPSSVWPSSQKKEVGKEPASEMAAGDSGDAGWAAMNSYITGQEEAMEKILSQVQGVGKVDVMLTLAASEEKKTLQNETSSEENSQETDSSGGSRKQDTANAQTESVLVDDGEGQEPYVVQIQSPRIEGVVVVAQGAGTGTINTEIIEAVQALFPIEPHKIKVMKME